MSKENFVHSYYQLIQFIGLLNHLARKAKNGIIPFSEAKEDDDDLYILFDDNNEFICPNDKDKICSFFPIVQECCITSNSKSIDWTYDDSFKDIGLSFYVCLNNKTGQKYVSISDNDYGINILFDHNGWWAN